MKLRAIDRIRPRCIYRVDMDTPQDPSGTAAAWAALWLHRLARLVAAGVLGNVVLVGVTELVGVLPNWAVAAVLAIGALAVIRYEIEREKREA